MHICTENKKTNRSLTAMPPVYLLFVVQTKVEWSNADGEPFVVLTFSSSTNRPALNNSVSINNALIFNHGDIEVSAGRGTWSPDGAALNITDLDPDSWGAITASVSNGTLHAKPREKLLVGATIPGESPAGQLRGNLTMRMSFPGQFVASLFVGEQLDSISAEVVQVNHCPDQVVLQAPERALLASSEIPSPFFAAEGVLSLPGEKWLKVRTPRDAARMSLPRKTRRLTVVCWVW